VGVQKEDRRSVWWQIKNEQGGRSDEGREKGECGRSVAGTREKKEEKKMKDTTSQ
jgi:hypothetical protein